MDHYARDLSIIDFNYNYSDPIFNPLVHDRTSLTGSSASLYDFEDDFDVIGDGSTNYERAKPSVRNPSPPKHRHDGKSPLPLGMDWSAPPRKWDGRNSVWPHDPRTGWSYCVTVPSWVVPPELRGSDPVVFYKVQVGIQSPEGITSTRVILRRFNDFLKLFSRLREEFPDKNLPPPPPKKILRIRSQMLLEERRCLLEDWLEKLLSDIDISRSAPAAIFLELEAAARSAFHNVNQQFSDVTSVSGTIPSFMFEDNEHISVEARYSSIASDSGNDTPYEVSDIGTPRHGKDRSSDLNMENSTSEHDLINPTEVTVEQAEPNKQSINTEVLRLDGTEYIPGLQDFKINGHVQRMSTESIGSDMDHSVNSLLQSSRDFLVALPSDERHKMNRVLGTLQQRLATAKTDVEDLLARLNQEMAARQFLTTKVKDMEVELETTRLNCRENMQQAVLTEKERLTQMQWDTEELRRKCLEMEMKLKHEEDERLLAESTKDSVVQENKMLIQELDYAREQLETLQKHHDEYEAKSKTDLKLLIKEVKSLRSSQQEMKKQLSELVKEKLDAERALRKEKQRMELSNKANAKLLHECGYLQQRLQECSVNFLVEEEDKLIVSASPSDALDDDTSPSDALDLLATSDNRIGLLLAEAQLLAQDVENAIVAADDVNSTKTGDTATIDDKLRMLLTQSFVDNATLRKQINSVIRCALNANMKSEQDDEEEDIYLRKTVLSKFLEK